MYIPNDKSMVLEIDQIKLLLRQKRPSISEAFFMLIPKPRGLKTQEVVSGDTTPC